MTEKTKNIGLTKPDETEFYDVNVTNENWDITDREIGNIKNPEIKEASARENIENGDNYFTILGKIKRFFSDLKKVAFTGKYQDLEGKPEIPAAIAVKGNAETNYRTGNVNLTPDNIGALAKTAVVSNNTTTVAGYALDARQANPNAEGSLAKQISTLNSGLAFRPVYPLYTGKTAVWGTRDDLYEVTADGYVQFWYNVDDDKHNSNCGINGFIDGVLVYEYFEYHQAGAANENYSPMFPVIKGQTVKFHIITDSVLQYAMIYHYPARV